MIDRKAGGNYRPAENVIAVILELYQKLEAVQTISTDEISFFFPCFLTGSHSKGLLLFLVSHQNADKPHSFGAVHGELAAISSSVPVLITCFAFGVL